MEIASPAARAETGINFMKGKLWTVEETYDEAIVEWIARIIAIAALAYFYYVIYHVWKFIFR